jgi:hypothetical protein
VGRTAAWFGTTPSSAPDARPSSSSSVYHRRTRLSLEPPGNLATKRLSQSHYALVENSPIGQLVCSSAASVYSGSLAHLSMGPSLLSWGSQWCWNAFIWLVSVFLWWFLLHRGSTTQPAQVIGSRALRSIQEYSKLQSSERGNLPNLFHAVCPPPGWSWVGCSWMERFP